MALLQRKQRLNDRLLNALLPAVVRREMIAEYEATGRVAVQPRRLASSAIMFCDIVDFTAFCEQADHKDVINCLDDLFKQFEAICVQHQLEKIKTIGDSFMATPNENCRENPVLTCIRAGTKMLACRSDLSPELALRIGVDFGEVVAGIVGEYRFQYDVWGRTVNMAARIESEGLDGRINLSAAAWLEVNGECQADVIWRNLKGLGQQPIHVFREFVDA